MNPAMLFKLKPAWNTFKANHPKFPNFLHAVCDRTVQEGTIIEVNVITPDGKTLSSNIKLKESDVELFESIKAML